MAEQTWGYLLFRVLFLLPYLIAAGIFFVLFRVSFRMQSPGRILLLYPTIGSLLICAAFLIWTQLQWSSLGPTAKTLTVAVMPFYLLATAFVGFVASWSAVYVVRFALEKLSGQKNRTTRIVFFLPALAILALTVWTVQWGVRRSLELSTASSETADPSSRQRVFESALTAHDSEVLGRLGRNSRTSVADLVRIYNACKNNFNKTPPNDYRVFYSLAQNPNTPAGILAVLATANEASTRIAVATNPTTPLESLRQLADDEDDLVRTWVSHNPNLPTDVLQKLGQDANEVTRSHAKAYMEEREKADRTTH